MKRKRSDLPGVVGDGCIQKFREMGAKEATGRGRFEKMFHSLLLNRQERYEKMDPKLRVIRDTKGTVAQHSRMAKITLPKLKCLEDKGED